MTWQVNVSDNYPFNNIAIWVGSKTDKVSLLLSPMLLNLVPHEEATIADPTLKIPEELGRALYEALARHYGPISDRDTFKMVRGDFEYERRRVDTLMNKLFDVVSRHE